ncbi:MAG: hypothetical protein Q9183_002963, partial [Haloplaca sp. 2 TL-2023]
NKGAALTDSWKGIYSADSKATLVLLIDIKKDSKKTLPVLLDQLAPLHKKGLLTHFDGTSTIQRPITIVASGETDHDAILDIKNRHVFFDAPLEKLKKDHDPKAEGSYYASASYKKTFLGLSLPMAGSHVFEEDNVRKIQKQVENAHSLGLKVRYWDMPGLPEGKDVWDLLWDKKVDVFNTDDLKAAEKYLRG